MRYINTIGYRPKKYLEILRIHSLELEKCPNKLSRNIYLDRNRTWNIVRPGLERLSHEKCWFTEAREAVSPLYIEHFRPKKRVTLISKVSNYPEARKSKCKYGYWWKAYDISNFRIAASFPNKKKGTYFPLEESSPIARSIQVPTEMEIPMFLDPCVKSDVDLLSFVGSMIEPLESDVSKLEYKRAKLTIDLFDLENRRLKISRTEHFKKCQKFVESAEFNWKKRKEFEGNNDAAFELATENFANSCSNLIEYLIPSEVYTKMILSYFISLTNEWINEFVLEEARSLNYID